LHDVLPNEENIMFDHIGLKVRNLPVAVNFYRAALAPLGFEICAEDPTYAGIGPAGAPSLWLYADDQAESAAVHLALRAESRAAVDSFYAAGLAAGGRDNGAPGLRPDYATTYYAAFLLDPAGNNVEAVCMR
jgi:catechol 2,3-dioxygenase-like lactoylglutathione lyase family enzyme